MTAQSFTPPGALPPSGASAGWLYGPKIDLLLGAGVLYLVSLPLLIGLEHGGQLSSWPIMVTVLIPLFIGGPHYGATILRVYDRKEDRQRYVLFAVWVTAAIAGLFVVSLHYIWLGSILFTLYATWNPWHFSGQNYGVALMFLRRRGIAVDVRTKRFIYASFVLSFVLAILVMHSVAATVTFNSEWFSSGSVYHFVSLGIPKYLTRIAIRVTALAYLFALGGAAVLLLRRARPIDLLPVACIAATQSLWFALPAALPVLARVRLDGLAFAAVWLSAAHNLQYLWVTSYYASQQALAQAGPRERDRVLRGWWARSLLAGSAVTIFPAMLFAPGLLGTVAFDNGLAILLVSVVNLHHFVLDGAIWKLRDPRIARLLLRDVPAGSESRTGSTARVRRGRWALAAVGAVSLAVAVFDLWEREITINRAGDDLEAISRASKRLAWIGRDPAGLHTSLAQRWSARGDLDRATAEYRRSIKIHESPPAWLGLGDASASRGEWREASEAYGEARRNLERTLASSREPASVEREIRHAAALESRALRAVRARDAPPPPGWGAR